LHIIKNIKASDYWMLFWRRDPARNKAQKSIPYVVVLVGYSIESD